MDPRRNLFPEEPEEENFQVELTSPPGIARNGGQAQGENDAQDAQNTQDAQNQPSTATNGNERENQRRERNNERGRAPTNGQNSAPNARYTPREQPNPYGGYQNSAYQQYTGPYSTNGGYQTGMNQQYTDPYSMNGGYQQGSYQQYPGPYTSNGGYYNAYLAQPGPYATQAYYMPFVYPQDTFQGYQQPTMQGEEIPPMQFHSPAELEAHAPWQKTDLAKFLTTCKTLELSFTGENWSDYRLNFTEVCRVMALQGFLDWPPPRGKGYPYPQNDPALAADYTRASMGVFAAIRLTSNSVERVAMRQFSDKYFPAAEVWHFLCKEFTSEANISQNELIHQISHLKMEPGKANDETERRTVCSELSRHQDKF